MENQLQKEDNIEVYNCYGNAYQLFIQGRMLYKKKFTIVKKDDKWFHNLYRRVRQIKSNDIPKTKIIATIKEQTFETLSDSEGYFEFSITLTQALTTGYENIELQIINNKHKHHTMATIVDYNSEGITGILSDFDDTVIISDITSWFSMARLIVFKNYKQRKIIAKMAEHYKKILSQNPSYAPSMLFFLSGSPQQLFHPIENFLTYHHFPKHLLFLKKIEGENQDPLFDQFAYKVEKIERIMELYPNVKWIMFGDSGEKDKQIYSAITQKYPDKINAFYIRDVKNSEIKRYS